MAASGRSYLMVLVGFSVFLLGGVGLKTRQFASKMFAGCVHREGIRMAPILNGVDHLHINVGSWSEAEEWYQSVLGFKRMDALMGWAVKNGPLTIENADGTIHLALFESESPEATNVIAFGATGKEFLNWKAYLESHGLTLRVADHQLAYSLYFSDPWKNSHEITTYERDYVAAELAAR